MKVFKASLPPPPLRRSLHSGRHHARIQRQPLWHHHALRLWPRCRVLFERLPDDAGGAGPRGAHGAALAPHLGGGGNGLVEGPRLVVIARGGVVWS